MNIFFSWAHATHFYICGDTKEDKRFYIEIHTGFSRQGLLGGRRGYHFHCGPTISDPVVAAVGYETMQEASIYNFSSDSIVILPPYDPYNPKSTTMTVEKMVARTTPDRRTVFAFSIEVGDKMRREPFEWRQINKGEDSLADAGGFKLLRLSPKKKYHSVDEGATDSGETVAIFAWTNHWYRFANIASTHPFSLHLVGSAKLGQLGDRWALMAVLTALRLDNLHKQGRTHYSFIHHGENIRDGN